MTKSKVSSTSKSIPKSVRNDGPAKAMSILKFVGIFVLIPCVVGVMISSRYLEFMSDMLNPVLEVIVPTVQDTLITYRILRKKTESFETISTLEDSIADTRHLAPDVKKNVEKCYKIFLKAYTRDIPFEKSKSNSNSSYPFQGISLLIHRNGESQPCGNIVERDISDAFKAVFIEKYLHNQNPPDMCTVSLFESKYMFESLLTEVFHYATKTACSSTVDTRGKLGFYGYCDMGEAKTPILTDHGQLVPIRVGSESFLPCHFHDKYGQRVSSLSKLLQHAKSSSTLESLEKDCTVNVDGTTVCARNSNTTSTGYIDIHLYSVSAGRMFIFSPSYIGEIIQLPHVVGGLENKPVYMKVLSLEPKIFDIFNFFSLQESNTLIEGILKETKESHRIKRSSTGATGYNLNDRRTSESGYDTTSATSMKVKKRCFDVLGFDEYVESHADGLQILRYNLTKAYIPHMDWIDGNDQLTHDYESEFKGGNRFATILLYFTDSGEMDGGETVFTETWPYDIPESERKNVKTAIRELRQSHQGSLLQPDSWEETLVAKCRSRLAIRPQSARAVLFYSQLPSGKPDPKSLHGGCPVLNGTKYAANLWVWNTPRDGYPGNPRNPNYKGEQKAQDEIPGKVVGTFRNSGNNPEFAEAKLYYTDQYWGPLGHGDAAISVNTYVSHVWNVIVNGKTVKTFEITSSTPSNQEFVI